MTVFTVRLHSPLGRLFVVADGRQLLSVGFAGGWAEQRAWVLRRLGTVTLREQEPSIRLRRAFDGYFAGRFRGLEKLDVDTGGSEFQQVVWAALRDIPAGETWTFGELAEAIGHPRSVRAVSRAVASNPIPLVLPCHRVTAAGGRVPGPERVAKRRRWLLQHESSDGFA